MNFNTFTPRSLKSTIGALSVMALLGLCSILSSCHDNETIKNYETVVSEVDPMPTTDQLDVTFDGKAMVFGSDRTDFNGCLVNRMNNLTNETSSDAKAFIFTKGYNAGLTVQEAKTMFEAYENNATFVLIDPVKTDRSALVDTLQAAINEALEEGKSTALPRRMLQTFSQYASSDKKIDGETEAIAINRNGIYVVRNLEEAAKNQSKNSTMEYLNESGDTIRQAVAEQDYAPNDYDHGKSADMLVNWMTRCANAGNKLFASGATTADGQLTAQMVTLQQFVGPTRAMEKKMLVEHNFEIYSLHNSKANEDYYLVHLNSAFYNSQLGCTEQDKSGSNDKSCVWSKVDNAVTLDDGTVVQPATSSFFEAYRDCWFGPYFRGATNTLTIETDNDEEVSNVTMLDPLPGDAINAGTTLTSGLNRTMTDVNIINNSIWGGKNNETVTFNQSFSHQYDGLRCVTEGWTGSHKTWGISGNLLERDASHPQNVAPIMVATRGVVKEVKIEGDWHERPDYFQHNDFDEDFSVIFVVKNPGKYQSFNLHFTNNVLLDELYALRKGGGQVDLLTWMGEENTIPLTMPTRPEEYVIECSDPNFLTKYESAIKSYTKEATNTEWNGDFPAFSVYGNSQEATLENARDVFYRFSQFMYVVAGRYNIKDAVTFYVHAKGSTDNLWSFKLQDGAIAYPYNYNIECSDPTFLSTYETAIKDYLKESMSTTWVGNYPQMTIYGTTKKEAESNARHSLYDFSQLVYVVANRYNIKGTMTFELHSESSNTLIGSFKLSDGIVSY